MTNAEVSYNWNGQDIRFNQWAPNAYGVYEYTSRNRRHYFRVDIQPAGGALRLYILDQPSYGGRPTDGHSTHRLVDEGGHVYICIRDDLSPTNVPDALTWFVYWAEQTSQYIDTGRAFS